MYFTLSLIGILHHEIWLDEAHQWLLARDSHSLQELVYNTRYEGHPILWNFLIYCISFFTDNPFWMQLFNIVISTITVFIFCKKAPFSLIFKTLFVFGHFMFFEYNLLSRNYMIGVLFLFLAITNQKKTTIYFVLLALAANTHLIFLVISFALFLAEFITKNYKKQLISFATLLYIIGLLLAIIQIIPPNDDVLLSRESSSLIKKIYFGFTSLFKGFFPMPDFRTIHFFNTNLFSSFKLFFIPVAFLVYFIPYILFKKDKKILFLFYIGLFGVHLMFFVINISAIRYYGITFILLIVSLWMYHQKQEQEPHKLIYLILIIQFIAGITSFTLDLKYPFSNGKDIATIINKHELDKQLIVTPLFEGSLISPFSQKKFYSLCSGSLQSFNVWKLYKECDLSKQKVLQMLEDTEIDNNFVFISKYDLIKDQKMGVWNNINNYSVKKIEQLDAYVIARDSYLYIYEIQKNK